MNVLTFVKFLPKEDFSRTILVGLEGVESVAIENEIVKGVHAIQFECFRVCPVYLEDYDAHPRNTSS